MQSLILITRYKKSHTEDRVFTCCLYVLFRCDVFSFSLTIWCHWTLDWLTFVNQMHFSSHLVYLMFQISSGSYLRLLNCCNCTKLLINQQKLKTHAIALSCDPILGTKTNIGRPQYFWLSNKTDMILQRKLVSGLVTYKWTHFIPANTIQVKTLVLTDKT